MSTWTEDEVDARQEAERDLDAQSSEDREPHCPQCGQHGADLLRAFGRGEHADYECGCGWRFRADHSGRVLREFGYYAA